MRAHVLRSRPGPACFVACCALPVLAFSPALPCPLRDTCPNPNDVSPDLQPADYEMQTNEVPTSAPGDCAPTSEKPAPIKMTNQQLDTPVHDGHCTLSSVIYFRPALHEELRPGQGKCDPSIVYTHIPLFRLYRARNPCPETLSSISRYRVK